MGFPIVEIRMPEYEGVDAQLREWLVPTGVYVTWNCPIAHVTVDDELHRLICNMPIVLEERKVSSGKVTPNQLLARAAAEGDEIPYGRPYSRIEKVV